MYPGLLTRYPLSRQYLSLLCMKMSTMLVLSFCVNTILVTTFTWILKTYSKLFQLILVLLILFFLLAIYFKAIKIQYFYLFLHNRFVSF